MSAESPVFPRALDDDDDDVSWALQTALVQWERGGHADAVVWLRRAGQAAVEAGEFGRAADLERSARSIESWMAGSASSPPLRTPKSLPPPRNPPPVPIDEDDFDGTDEVDALLASEPPEIEAFATAPTASMVDAIEAEAREQLTSDELVSDESAAVADLGDVEDIEDIVEVDDFEEEPAGLARESSPDSFAAPPVSVSADDLELPLDPGPYQEHHEESTTHPPSRSPYKLPPPPVLPPPARKSVQASLDRSVQRPAGNRLGRSERPPRVGDRKSSSERPRSERPPRAELPPRNPRSIPPPRGTAPPGRNPPVTRPAPAVTSRVITQRGMPLPPKPPAEETTSSQFPPEPDTQEFDAMRTQPRASRPRDPQQSATTEISVVELLDAPSQLEIIPAEPAMPSGMLAMLEGTGAEETPILRPPSAPSSEAPRAPDESPAPPPPSEAAVPPQATYSEIIVESEPPPPPESSVSPPVSESVSEPEPAAIQAPAAESVPSPAAAEVAAPKAESGIDVELIAGCRGLEDLPPETQADLAARGRLETLAPEQEVSGFGLAIVARGDVLVMPTIAEAACGYAQRGEPVFSRGNLSEGVALRAVAMADGAEVAVFKSEDFEHMLETCPWVAEELRTVADRFQALAGAAMGPLGDRLDDNMRGMVTERCTVKLLGAGEVLLEQGKPVGGLQIVGGGRLELVRDGSIMGELVAGDLPFASDVLSHAPATATLRAGPGGALILEADRMTTHELLVSVPPLLELLASC
jgi:hypothetical protein